jgi:hypothetical protein
MTVI